ncbi:immunoglobulin domain-containing protein [Brevifollis gellanilyticus]|uniref:Ig-like domain-containing protein n=1 Tax=Brevifollis gellanilyticus TaxID=748831 RepID=A0A512MAL8_9BACT|nr:immunoglobulin domain-containing protein [Brevifollis gellanilyticus]GEP43391.1 hypothetical protein BGE01nite_26820 [Brevifollis gellanilyticus]
MKSLPTRLLPTLGLVLLLGSQALPSRAAEALPDEQQITEIQAGEGLGTSIAMQSNEVFLGAPYYSNARGRVQVGQRTNGVWSASQTLESPNPTVYSYFGLDVAVSAGWLAVSDVSLRDTRGFDVGRVHLFRRIQGTSWQLAQTLTAPARPPYEETDGSTAFQMRFGAALEMHGSRLVVQDDNLADGMVTTTLRIYRLVFNTWEPEAVIQNVSTRPEYQIPMPMRLHDNKLALGDPWWTNKLGWNTGRVQIFRFTGTAKKGKWDLDQVMEPGELSDSSGLGAALGFTGFSGEEIMMGSSKGFWTSEWDGKRWSKARHVSVPDDQRPPYMPGTPDMAMYDSNIAIGNLGALEFCWRGPEGWVRDQSRRVPNAHGLALTQDTVAFWRNHPTGQPRSVSFLPLLEMSVWLGRARSNSDSTGREAVPSGTSLRWQAWADGQVLPLEVDLPAQAATARTARLSGPAAALFSITPLDNGATKTSRFEVRPLGLLPAGDQTFTIHFEWFAASEYTVDVTWEQSSHGQAIVSLPAGKVQKLGQRLILSPVIKGFTAPTFIWKRDGKVLADQTGAALDIASAKPEHAGAYELEVRGSQEGARVAGPCLVAVFEPVDEAMTVADEQTVQLKTKLWGPARVQWHKSPSFDDPTSPFVAGVYQPTLTIIRGRYIGPELREELIATVDLLGPEGQSIYNGGMIARYTVLSVDRLPRITPSHQMDWAVGDEILDPSPPVNPTYAKDQTGNANAWPGSRLTASGLPPGIRLEEMGSLTGTFTKAGVYKVTWQLTDARGLKSAPVTSVFRVGQPLRIVEPGLFAGRVTGTESLQHFKLGGMVEIKTTEKGCFSGVLRIGADTRQFAGKLAPNPDSPEVYEKVIILPALRGTGKSRLTLITSPADGVFQARLGFSLPGAGDDEEETLDSFLYFRSCDVTAASYSPDTFGRYNLLLTPQPASEHESPTGTSFMSMCLKTTLCAHVVGTLSDGTGFTFSSPVMPAESPIPFYFHDASRCSTLAGEVQLNAMISPIAQMAARWMQAAKPVSKNYPAGFMADLTGEGSLYIPPPPGLMLFSNVPDAPGNAIFQTDFIESHLLRLTTNHRAIPHTTAAPNRLCRIDFYPPTGFFTGQFVMNEWENEIGSPLPPRKVDFRGMVTPMWSVGRGFCCFPRVQAGGPPLQVSTPGSEPPLSQDVRIFGNP